MRGLCLGLLAASFAFTSPALAFHPDKIPNGYTNPGAMTGGRCIVCHLTSGGGGACTGGGRCLNVFGNDFINGPNGIPDNPASPTDGMTWSQWLAERDSDGDGWSNGQELGDSYRLWSSGNAPDSYRGNPGFSSNEPSNANLCSDSDRNDCASSGGTTRGQCSDGFNGTGRYTCSCGTGSTGTGYRRTQSHNWSGSTPGTRRYDIRSLQAGCTDINECFPNPCGVGSCSENDPAAGYSCSCPSGYQFNGSTCVNINECLSNPCGPNGVMCTDMTPGYTCTCDPGFAFNGTTCVVTDACLAGTDDCDPNAECSIVRGTYFCTCNMGWQGVGTPLNGTGDRCVDINECATMPGVCGVGSCLNNAGGYTCTCPTGYAFNGTTCRDIDECLGDPCGVGGTECRNMPGSFTCSCSAGYMFDGSTCIDINECAGNPCGEGECIETDPGATALGYACSCDGGYSFVDTTCVDDDECLTPEVSLCSENAMCRNFPGGFECTCNEGYTGDGRSCLDIDECADGLDDCDIIERATCTNTEGSYICACREHYEGSGVTCRDINECTDGTGRCETGEVCMNQVGAPFTCECAPGFIADEESGECVRACGDGNRTAGEACDDGNTDSGDGCSDACEVERGWACLEPPVDPENPDDPRPSNCTDTCGDGLVQPSEECDDGADMLADEPNMCRTTCDLPRCGDSILDDGEECDNGEMGNSDSDANACRSSCMNAFCGDGVVDDGETCDPGGDTPLSAEMCACADDAGTTDDAGVDGGEGSGGGGCSTSGTGTSMAWLLALGVVFRRRRR